MEHLVELFVSTHKGFSSSDNHFIRTDIGEINFISISLCKKFNEKSLGSSVSFSEWMDSIYLRQIPCKFLWHLATVEPFKIMFRFQLVEEFF